MPEVLQDNPLIIVVIVLVLVLLIAIPVLIRRRRASAEEVLPPPDVGSQVDYTSLPYEEPTTLADRFRNSSIGTKLLIFLVPLVLIVGGVIAYIALFSGGGQEGATTQNVVQYSITNVKANVAGANKILVQADTNLPTGTQVTVALLEGGQGFAWIAPESITTRVGDRRIQATVDKANDAPVPREGQEYTVVLSAAAEGQNITSDPAVLDVPGPVRGPFFGIVAAATSVPTNTPTSAPSPSTPTAIPAATAPPPEPTAGPALSAAVFNGGNIRPQPRLGACNGCPQLHAGETVTLLEKTGDGRWYRVKAPDGEGWVSVTLLRIDAQVADQVPIQGQSAPPTPGAASGLSATVFHGGNVRETPVTGRPLDQVNAGETVQLLEKTADGAWYKITTIRGITGWVSVTLLRIDAAVAKQVPVAP